MYQLIFNLMEFVVLISVNQQVNNQSEDSKQLQYLPQLCNTCRNKPPQYSVKPVKTQPIKTEDTPLKKFTFETLRKIKSLQTSFSSMSQNDLKTFHLGLGLYETKFPLLRENIEFQLYRRQRNGPVQTPKEKQTKSKPQGFSSFSFPQFFHTEYTRVKNFLKAKMNGSNQYQPVSSQENGPQVPNEEFDSTTRNNNVKNE